MSIQSNNPSTDPKTAKGASKEFIAFMVMIGIGVLVMILKLAGLF